MSYETISFSGFKIKIGKLKDGYRFTAFKGDNNNQYFKNHDYFKSKEEALDYVKNKILEHNQISLKR